MIQRIQSLFLLLASAASFGIFFSPFARFYSGDIYCEFSALRITSISSQDITMPNTWMFIALAIVIGLISFITIFLYKNRKLQSNLSKINIFLNIFLILIIFFYADNLSKIINVEATYKLGAYLPIVSLLFLILANRFIIKDEKLVRSADRLR